MTPRRFRKSVQTEDAMVIVSPGTEQFSLNSTAAEFLPDTYDHIVYRVDHTRGVIALQFEQKSSGGDQSRTEAGGGDQDGGFEHGKDRMVEVSTANLFTEEFGVDPSEWENARMFPVSNLDDCIVIDINSVL